MKDIYKMELHECANIRNGVNIMRVPGGWIYSCSGNPVFVPEKAKRATVKIFRPPSLDEVADYIREKQSGIDPDKFWNHYESNNWMVGKNKMKDWKAAVRHWSSKHEESRSASQSRSDRADEAARDYLQKL